MKLNQTVEKLRSLKVSELYHSDIQKIIDDAIALHEIVAKLPKDVDGKPLVDGDVAWAQAPKSVGPFSAPVRWRIVNGACDGSVVVQISPFAKLHRTENAARAAAEAASK